MKLTLLKSTVVATVAILVSAITFPLHASAAPSFAGNIEVDCDPGYLSDDNVYYFELGDTFTITNIDDAECLILDPNNILTGEDADHTGGGAGILGESDGTPDTTNPITIDSPGTFTITEDGGNGAVRTFTVAINPYFLFTNGSDVGVGAAVGNTFLYEGVIVIDGTIVDATVTINRTVNLASAPTLDDENDSRIGSSIDAADGMDGFLEYTVDFHADNDPSTPILISNLVMTVKDIDNSQYIAAEGVDSFNLSSSPVTKLTPRQSGNTLFIEELNSVSSSSSDEDHWAVLKFDSTSSVTLRIGSKEGGASFGVVFSRGANEEFSNPPTEINTDSLGGSGSSTLATTGANLDWLALSSLIAIVGGSAFFTLGRIRRKRTA
jgi:hypothetical protein